jgi:hypothetical protein
VGVTSSDSAANTDTVTPTDTPTDASTSATPTRTTTAPAPPAPSLNTCAFDQLGIRALRGSGANQQEFAAVFFSNKGTTTCTIYGYPGISLRYQGQPLGQPASRDSTTPTAIKLKPGDVVQADITDNSSCQAPLSDTVRVYPPDSTRFVDLPLQLRGCTLSVKPVAAS